MKKYEKQFKVFQNNTKKAVENGCTIESKSFSGSLVELYEVDYNNEIKVLTEYLNDIAGCIFNYDNGSMKCQMIDHYEDEGYGCSRWSYHWANKEVFVTLQAAKEYVLKNKKDKIKRLEEEILKIKKEIK